MPEVKLTDGMDEMKVLDSLPVLRDWWERFLREPFSWTVQRHVNSCAEKADIILDVGGRHAPYTRRLTQKIVIVDMFRSEGQSNRLAWDGRAIKRLRQWPTTVPVCGDACSLPFSSGLFDLVVCTEVLEHIPEDERALREIARVMKKNGTLFATVPNSLSRPDIEPDHFRHYSPEQLKHVAEKYFGSICVFGGVRNSLLLHWSFKLIKRAYNPQAVWGFKKVILLIAHVITSLAALVLQELSGGQSTAKQFSVFMRATDPREP